MSAGVQMTIPGFQSLMLPLLKIASDEAEHNHAEVRDSLAVHFEISDSEKKEMLSSGKQARFDNRVAWAIVYMRRAGLIENSSRGIFHITVQGLDLLKTNPDKIDIKLLKQLNPAVRDWGKISDQPIDNERDMIITTEKRDELLSLFQEFVTYLLTPEGEKHSAYYQRAHEESRKNIENIKFRFDQGEDVTNEVLAKLLPYSDIPSNRENGYWISIAPAFSTDVKIKFEAAGWRKDGWSEVANAILSFVLRCDEQPDQLSKACTEFSDSPYSKGFQTGTLTPILNALRPDKFVLINNKPRRVLNYFTDKSYIQSLSEYPEANSTALSLIGDIEEDIQILSKKNLLAVDLFDEFSHWLIAIKHHPLGSTVYWKIAPGENAWNWDACREGGFIAIGWEEIGDVSNLSKSQFNSRRDDLLKEHPDWNKIEVEQVWKFAHIKEGDRIIANKGTNEVLGIGTATGPYYFVEGLRHGHRIPVEWENLTTRRINKPGWRKTLIELAQAEFDSIYTSNPIDICKIFKDREEAEWAFALMRETLNHLGIKNSDDERFAITRPSRGTAIHLNFGQWLVLGFNFQDIGANRIEMALLADQKGLFSKFESFEFAQGKNELDIKLYKFPIELINPMASDLRRTYDKSLQYIAEKFGHWQATPWRKNNIREISDALFDDSKLGFVLDLNFKINIWWVNQGSTIDEEKKGYLWAPTKTEKGRSIYHWDNLLEVKQGDIILHYANGYLNYISKVLTSAEKTKNPHAKRSPEWAEEGNEIRVSYFDLTPPIALSKFSQSVLELDIKQGPFNRNGGINQGYLFKLTPEALNIIQNSQKETTWPEFARISLNRPAWIFQSNPKYYNIEGALEVLTEMNWLVNQYPKQIRAGDTVYIWKSGKEGGIIAVGTILTNPTMMSMESKTDHFVIDETKFVSDALRVRVRIDYKLPGIQRIGRENFKNHPVLSSMEIVNFADATNFMVKPEHAQSLHDLVFGNRLEPAINAEYRLDQCSKDTGLRLDTLESWVRAIERKGQAILYGPPGTGKTFVADHLAKYLIGGGDGFKELVQFHPAYSYEDFVQGIRPKSRDDGKLEYSLAPGRFLNFCQKARGCKGICVLIIDEINRANLSRVFGELMYLLEYREDEIPLAADETLFGIPRIVRIIGTMNTADRSIALVDHALRRRFAFLRLQPEYNTLRSYHEREETRFPIDKLIQILTDLNREIGDPHYEVGISYFIWNDLEAQIADIWTMEIEPYLEEYFFNDPDKIKNYRWDTIKDRLNP